MVQTKQHPAHAASTSHNEGERLENQMWAEIKALNMKEIEKKLAPEFQSIHLDGQRNRTAELELIKNLHLGEYTISNLKSTQEGDTLVVTYQVALEETINKRSLSHKPSSRLSVWKKNRSGEWQWIAHANLISLGRSQ